VVKLKGFKPFTSAAMALDEINNVADKSSINWLFLRTLVMNTHLNSSMDAPTSSAELGG